MIKLFVSYLLGIRGKPKTLAVSMNDTNDSASALENTGVLPTCLS